MAIFREVTVFRWMPLLAMAVLVIVVYATMSPHPADAGQWGGLWLGGAHSGGGSVVLDSEGGQPETVSFLEILNIPVQSPPCDKPFFSIHLSGLEIDEDGETFDFTSPAGTVHGEFFHGNDGETYVDGTVDLNPSCEAHITFHVETGAHLQGDADCSTPLSGAQALTRPQAAGGVDQNLTGNDVITLLRHIVGPLHTPIPSPSPAAAGTGGCAASGTQTPLGVMSGDTNCDHYLTPADVLVLVHRIAGLTQLQPTRGTGCVPAGQFYYDNHN